ncbi:hypothetical protein C8046_00795 [Serinibacter arcticus]|uniref:Uncharacterized protein n=1 Tax=Serinibacter arcticus TaxID=1655435 RepID=A0A2U1ZR98_9MICO|nr:hypothetical protein [Serinibacter arcticus]PWD49473.1 hypothetical protein C8046_00795 [Serinibacter arcticus]
MIILDEATARRALERVGTLQREITELGGDARTGADEIADLLQSVVLFLKSSGSYSSSLREHVVTPMWEWAMYTIAPRALREDDAEARYLVDKIIALRSELEDGILRE